METQNITSAVDNPVPTPTPITPEELVTQLRAYRERIPDYGQLTIPAAQQRRRAASLNTGFVISTINAAGASDTVQTAIGQTPADLQLQQSDIVRWTAVEDELRAMLKGVASANLVRRHRLGTAALQTYAISRNLVRQPEHADLLPHVQEMKRLAKHKKAEKIAEPKPADPTSQQTTPSPAEQHPAPSQS